MHTEMYGHLMAHAYTHILQSISTPAVHRRRHSETEYERKKHDFHISPVLTVPSSIQYSRTSHQRRRGSSTTKCRGWWIDKGLVKGAARLTWRCREMRTPTLGSTTIKESLTHPNLLTYCRYNATSSRTRARKTPIGANFMLPILIVYLAGL